MGRKNNRRGSRPLNQDVIADILAESGRKNQAPSVSGRAAATTPSPACAGAPSGREPLRGGKLTLSQSNGLGDGGFTREEADASKEPMTDADRAYAHAVEVCDRIIRELDEQLEGYQCPRR